MKDQIVERKDQVEKKGNGYCFMNCFKKRGKLMWCLKMQRRSIEFSLEIIGDYNSAFALFKGGLM